MIAQRHKILRQVLEVRECPPEAAQRVRSDLRDVYYRRLLPVIERVCSELSSSERIHRIDTLEIDLGEVPLEAIEPAVAARFEAAFGRELAAAIGDAPEVDAELELFSYFIWTGTLPWWANQSERNPLEASLDDLIRRAPQALRRAMRGLPDQERMRRRIVRAYPDRALQDLAGMMAPALSAAYPEWSAAWTAVLGSASGTAGHSARAARNVWWDEVLRAADAENVAAADAPRFFRAILARAARRLGFDYRSLIAELRRAPDDTVFSLQPWVRDITEDLWRELGGDAAKTREPAPGVEPPVRPDRVDLMLLSAPPEGVSAPDAALSRLSDAVPDAVVRKQDAPVDMRFSDVDELYVENAGLAILWPFLEKFFERLGLTEEKRFKDEAAVQRAIGLLQYAAAGDESPAEYLLPLNKVLCGMAPEEVFDFGPEITATEIEECKDLLVATIQQAPILRDMSIDGFRGSFLLRKGQLGTRDGNWLLRVERETHDVVLDRFPWSVHFVKLPWMEAMMQVEW